MNAGELAEVRWLLHRLHMVVLLLEQVQAVQALHQIVMHVLDK